jgi:HAD superfamily hydrolase (TIGR01509 family)
MTLPFMPHAIVFDMDGLLLETESMYQSAFHITSVEGGYGLPVEFYQRLCGSTWSAIGTMLREESGADFPVDIFGESWRKNFETLMADGVPLKPGVLEMLDLLDELELPRAIATSSHRQSVDKHLGPHNVLGRFDHILSRESYSEAKPAPMPYLTAASRLGIDPKLCLALEDSLQGVRSASRAGMMTVMVPDVVKPTDEMRSACVMIADNLIAVRDVLQRTRAV